MSAVSKVSISNKALSLLKAENRINSLIADTSLEARLCNQFFDDSLDTLLEEHPWNFATTRQSLAQSADVPIYGFTYKYQLPTSPYCLKVLKVSTNYGDELTDWKITRRFIECDTDGISIEYIMRIDNLTELSTLFREALGFYLASKLAEPLLNSTTVANRMENNFRYFIKRAKRSDSEQGVAEEETIEDYSWETARFS